MIYDTFNNINNYSFISNTMKDAIEFLTKSDLDAFLPGRYKIKGDDISMIVVDRILTSNFLQWESHKKFIDLHLVLKGSEVIKYTKEDLTVDKPYSVDKDCEIYLSAPQNAISCTLHEGDFIIFLPNEKHLPNIKSESFESVKKVIVKIVFNV